jgi:monoterpene epsilon-lactone hydrolase
VAREVWVDESPVGPVVHPPGPVASALLYLHGALDVDADLEAALRTARELAVGNGATVVVCRYRPAFAETFVEDVLAGYRYCRDLGPVAVVGERMGATLAAALMVQLRDWGTPLPRCAVLISGVLDLTLQSNSVFLNLRPDPMLDVDDLRRRIATYAGAAPLTDPLVSPLHANLHGLAPVQLLVTTTDLLLDDSLAFAARAARSGVTVDLRVWPDSASMRADALPAMTDFIAACQRGPLVRSPRPA